MINYDKLQISLKRLEEQQINRLQLDPSLPKLIKEGVSESVIRRFKTCYDCLWKVLRRYLVEKMGMTGIQNSPKPIMRHANENNLLASSIEQWLKYADARISVAHDYDGEKAEACLALVPDFIDDAIALYQTMTGIEWK